MRAAAVYILRLAVGIAKMKIIFVGEEKYFSFFKPNS
jgi:hypothetical protein